MVTIGDRLAAHKGVGPGFDFLRIALAVAVVCWHADNIVTGQSGLNAAPVVWFPGYAILAMFFGLSGFLISGSALRLRLKDFLINRALRIFPALMVEIALCAFVLGLVFTTLPPAGYLARAGVYHYLTNIVGLINYQLPGVFTANPSHLVNVSLWTIPYELACYAIMSVLMVTAALKRPWVILAAIAVFMLLGLILLYGGFADPASGVMGKLADNLFTGRGSRLFTSFMLGIATYLYRDRIPYDWTLAAACLGICLLVAFIGPNPDLLTFPMLNLLVGPALAYLTAYLGVTRLPVPAVFRRGDYSYGVYLYGYPLQQTCMALFPDIHSRALQLLIALPLIVLFSVFSWHVIEKPVLGLRKRFSFVARARGLETPPAEGATPPAKGVLLRR